MCFLFPLLSGHCFVNLLCLYCIVFKVGRSAHLHYRSAADLLMKQNTLQSVFGVPGIHEFLYCIYKVSEYSCLIKI